MHKNFEKTLTTWYPFWYFSDFFSKLLNLPQLIDLTSGHHLLCWRGKYFRIFCPRMDSGTDI